jgi:hypothetical protein
MERDACFQSLFYISFRVPSKGTLPPGSLHKAPTERDTPPPEPLLTIIVDDARLTWHISAGFGLLTGVLLKNRLFLITSCYTVTSINQSIILFHPFDNNVYRIHPLFLVLSFYNSN